MGLRKIKHWITVVKKKKESITHVRVNTFVHFNTLVFRCSNVSPTNCGSSLIVILYREMNIVKIAIPSVSKNLLEELKQVT